MDRVSALNYGVSGGKRIHVDVTPTAPGTEFAALWHNGAQESIILPVEAIGLVPTDADNTQLFQVIERLAGSAVTQVNANGTLTAANAGLVVINATGGNIAVTMPSAAALAGTLNGSTQISRLRFDIQRIDTTTNTVTLAAPTGVTFVGGATSMTVSAGQSLAILSDGVSVLYVEANSVGSATQIQYAATAPANDNSAKVANTSWLWTNAQALVASVIAAVATAAGFASSAGTNGYLKLPSWLGGFVFQWQTVSGVANNTGFGVTFPITFPTACYLAFATVQSGTTISYQCTVNSLSVNGFTLIIPSGFGGTWSFFVFSVGK